MGALALAAITGFLAGSYPALALSSFRILHILKGQIAQGFKDVNLRRGLVVVQFVLALLLIVGAFGVRSQIAYIRDKNIGLDKNNVIHVPLPGELAEKYALIREELINNPDVAEVTAVDGNPLRVSASTGDPKWEGFSEEQQAIFKVLTVDHDFVELMRVQLAAGEDFTQPMTRDTSERKYIVNEAAARTMNLDDPVGKSLRFWGDEGRIIGVARDFHIASLHEPIAPLILRLSYEGAGQLLIRPAPGRTAAAIDAVGRLHKRLAPEAVFKYEFLDKTYASMYVAEATTGRLADLFALVAVLISCLGLIGLASFNAERRIREIGIRKVLGASGANLFWLLNRELGLLLGLAFAAAVPLAWWLLRNWLGGFAYHTDVDWRLFALSGGLLLLIAVLTVSFHSMRAARANPTESLRME
jgi:hypothetical protein